MKLKLQTFCLFVHDQINELLPDNFKDYLSLNSLGHIRTINSKTNKLFVPFVNTTRWPPFHKTHLYSFVEHNIVSKFTNTDFSIIKRNDLKKLLTKNILDSY